MTTAMDSLKRVWYVFGFGITLGVVFLFVFRFRQYVLPPPPGYSVALLGALAIVMTFVLPKEPSKTNKAAWILGAFLLMALEMWAISHDRKEQNANFQKIAGDLTTTIHNNQVIVEQAERILRTTQQVGDIAQENLRSVTGGKSFAIVTPQVFTGLVPIPLTIRNFGAETLTGVTVTVRGPEAWDAIENPGNPYSMFRAEANRIDVGTLHSGEIKVLAQTITPTINDASKDRIAVYDLDIAAQNFTAQEHLLFKTGVRIPWVYQYTVLRQFIKSQNKGTTTFGYETLAKTTRWYGEN
jgi:hypothetical protein